MEHADSLISRIHRRAFEIYVQRGKGPGQALNDWLQAEQDVLRKREAAIDAASEDSFPASDPPAH